MIALEAARQAKRAADENLAAVRRKVAELDARLATLQKAFLAATDEKSQVEAEAAACRAKLNLASRLVDGLASERTRWEGQLTSLQERESTYVGDLMLAAAFASYCGPFDIAAREKLWRTVWLVDLADREIPYTPEVTPLSVLVDEVTLATWQTQGLPTNSASSENAAIVLNSSRWPLLIDPQLQGVKWLLAKFKQESIPPPPDAQGNPVAPTTPVRVVVTLRTTTKQWQREIEVAMASGATVVLEDVDDVLDPFLEPILSRRVYSVGRKQYLKIADRAVEYHNSFQLFLQTSLSNPHFRPEVQAYCAVVNFTVTKAGLEDQLLAYVVESEIPDVEVTRASVRASMSQYKIQLSSLEDDLLQRLADAPEDILSDVPLINSLEATKVTVDDITRAAGVSNDMQRRVEGARDVYRPVAAEGASMYFLLTQLANLNHMYRFSLRAFTLVFLKVRQACQPFTHVPRSTLTRSLACSLACCVVLCFANRRWLWLTGAH